MKSKNTQSQSKKLNPLERARRDYRIILRGRPGERFMSFYKRNNGKGPRSLAHRVTYVSGGIALIAFGGLLGFAPFLPGIVPGVVGTAMVVSQLRCAADFLDRTEMKLRSVLGKPGGSGQKP
jgi:hypothetical protein